MPKNYQPKKDKSHSQNDRNALLKKAYIEYHSPWNTKEEKSHWKGVITALSDNNYTWSFPQIRE
jgi:hypothetical protein